jgi:hypothetical protein
MTMGGQMLTRALTFIDTTTMDDNGGTLDQNRSVVISHQIGVNTWTSAAT